ncbi:MAG TPA: sterol desaturase family protein [Acidimicrobiia bacterium]|nr:sterol desaturase family protein [Acidimicrobiia bacterium]
MTVTPDPTPETEARRADRPTKSGVAIGLLTVAAIVIALVTRGAGVVGLAVLFLIFVPLEKLFALRPMKVFRRGFLTDLTHLLVDNLLITVGLLAAIVVAFIPFFWLRHLDVVGGLPTWASVTLAAVIVLFGQYWAHRATHQVPLLWRFHSVHHSIENMDWLASARLHPVDQIFTHAAVVLPLFLLGYSGNVFGGVVVFFTLLALFQHANVRLRFPVLRWVINTPEWHHWHHALDGEAINTNFGVPIVDRLFGTAYMPKGKVPTGFGTAEPVPPVGYVRQLAYPFTRAAKTGRASGQ